MGFATVVVYIKKFHDKSIHIVSRNVCKQVSYGRCVLQCSTTTHCVAKVFKKALALKR